ncbi:hypothetical protein BDZ45DRAFT_600993, partial [Acephala macrosclerotiorum]
FQDFLKRTRIENKTTYNLKFQLLHVSKHFHLPVLFEALNIHFNKNTSADVATSHDAGIHSKMHSITMRTKYVPWKLEKMRKYSR